ncbi:zona pellucida sperm-binding protein 3-like [Dicentrarchus labrax]|uniref:zona pellucida sperm-binding protein 3-like n=1 Tax=Dicentrarchus labrax TaxID=13489 RepID=UPI0021F68196|nr:zona pellucida sperm-binding protein 3-like [Dicentrarchus labrax]
MRSKQLFVISFMLACVRLSNAGLSRRVTTYLGQKPSEVEAEPVAGPEREYFRGYAQQAGRLQAEQRQPVGGPILWKYPEDPVDLVKKPPVGFKLRQPVMTNPVAVRCGESRIQVEVSQDLLGLGKLIKPEEVTLGGCPATEIDNLSHVLIFECELHHCGSTLVMTEKAFIYTFALVYDPKVSSRSHIIRSQGAVIGVQCHYPK